jgi:hypothetical protein
MRNLSIILFFTSLSCTAQVNISLEKWDNVANYLRPIFQDSTMLFFSDSLIWYCHCSGTPVSSYYPISKVSFEHIDSCKCFGEKYTLVKDGLYGKPTYQLAERIQYGSLIRINDKEFSYREFGTNGAVQRTNVLIFEFSDIIETDSITAFNNQSCKDELTVYRYFRTRIKY